MISKSCDIDNVPLLADASTDAEQASIIGSGHEIPKPQVRTPAYVVLLSLLSAIGGFLFGYDTGIVSGALLPIQEQFHFDIVSKELFVSITVGAAAIFAIVGGQINDRLGRKPSTLIASAIFALGAILLAASQSSVMLLIGRFILGIGIGFSSCTVPLYIAECSPAHLRGRLVSLSVLCITGGQFVAGMISAVFCYDKQYGWRYMLGLAGVPPAIQFVGFLFMPESPRWLIDRGHHERALTVLRKIRGSSDVDEEFSSIRRACEEEAEARRRLGGETVAKKVWKNKAVRRALILGCCLQIFQQITGINTVMYYSATIVRMAGVSDMCQAIWLASLTALSNFLFTFVGIALVEKVGRRTLFLVSLAGVTLSLIFLGVSFQVQLVDAPSAIRLPQSHDRCSREYSSCRSCMEDDACGYCYTSSNGSAVTGTCVSASVSQLTSSDGACSNSIIESETHSQWAYGYCPSSYSWMAILGMILYLACFSPGMGPMPWTINSEMYPLWARSFCNSLSTFFNWAFNLLISMTFLSLSKAISTYGAFYLYAAFGVVGLIVFYLFLPETKGIALEDMEKLFSGSWFVKSKRTSNWR